MEVLLDSNFILDLLRFKVGFDAIEEVVGQPCKLLVPTTVLRELERISTGKTKEAGYAKLALRVVRKLELIKSLRTKADEDLIALAKGRIVATNDRVLRKRLRDLRIKTLYLRSKKYLSTGD